MQKQEFKQRSRDATVHCGEHIVSFSEQSTEKSQRQGAENRRGQVTRIGSDEEGPRMPRTGLWIYWQHSLLSNEMK